MGADSKRKFTVRFDDGTEKHQFEVEAPVHAAKKAARRLIDPNGFTDPDTAREENSQRVDLREIGTRTLHVYEAWTWIHSAACSECGSRRVYYRKEKTPKYRCGSCGAEFEDPADPKDSDVESDLPDYLDDELTEAAVDSRGRSKVPKDEIKVR